VLVPDTIDKDVDKENPIRFIDAFVDSLNLEKLGFIHSSPADTGLEKECYRNVEVMWLMKRLAPDHKTTADFRKDNADCIKSVFKEFVYLSKSSIYTALNSLS
jgi:transposase